MGRPFCCCASCRCNLSLASALPMTHLLLLSRAVWKSALGQKYFCRAASASVRELPFSLRMAGIQACCSVEGRLCRGMHSTADAVVFCWLDDQTTPC